VGRFGWPAAVDPHETRGFRFGEVPERLFDTGVEFGLAPANAVHALRNVGGTPAVLCIAYPSVNVGTYYVDGIEF